MVYLPISKEMLLSAFGPVYVAAPELLDVLENITAELQIVSDEQDGRFGKVIDNALTVIAKGKGESYGD